MIARTSGNGTADKLFVIPEGNLFVSGKNVCCKCTQCTTGIRYLPLIAGTSDDGTSDKLFVIPEGNPFESGKNVCCKCIQCTTGIRYLPMDMVLIRKPFRDDLNQIALSSLEALQLYYFPRV